MVKKRTWSLLKSVLLMVAVLLFFILVPQATIASDDGSGNGDDNTVTFCDPDNPNDAEEAIRNVFIVLQVLGPLFAILFYSGMTVADAATLEPKYQDQRRKVLLYGFSVPLAILFLDAIAAEVLISGDISCYFPGGG